MTRLLRVEITRLLGRRLVAISFAGALVLTGLVVLGVWRSSEPMSAFEEAQAREAYDMAVTDWAEHGDEMVAECLQAEQDERERSGEDVDFRCADMEPQEEWFFAVAPPLEDSLPGALRTEAYLLVLLGLVVGATFVAAEVATGSLGTWLTFEPRRLRVYATKVVAPAVVTAPVALVLLVAVTAGAWLVARSFGLAGGMTSEHWSAAALTALRIVVLAAAVAAVAAALAFLLRHTAAVLGVVVGYVVVVEMISVGMLGELQRWTLATNLRAWVAGRAAYYVDVCTSDPGGTTCETLERTVGLTQAGVVLLAVSAAIVVAGALVFRRRDI